MAFPKTFAASQVGTSVVTVSPLGIKPGTSSISNNGAMFGPDTPGTFTYGLQEAINSLPNAKFRYFGGGITVQAPSGVTGKLSLASGVFLPIFPVSVPPFSTITVEGKGKSSYGPGMYLLPNDDLGGTQIVGNCVTAQGFLLSTFRVPGGTPGFATTTGTADVSTFAGAGVLQVTMGTTPLNNFGWISLPVSTGIAILSYSGAALVGGSTYNLTGVNLIGLMGFNGLYLTAGVFQVGASVIQYQQNGAGGTSWGMAGGVNPATELVLRDLDIRGYSPTNPAFINTASNGYALANVCDVSGMAMGEVSNINVIEVAAAGGVGSNLGTPVFNCSGGPASDKKLFFNILGSGGYVGCAFNTAHATVINVTGAQNNYGGATGRAIDIAGNFDNGFYNLHAYSTFYGLSFAGYPFGQWQSPTVIDGFHFESVAHYLFASSAHGYLKMKRVNWNSGVLNPITDIAATMGGGFLIETEDEDNQVTVNNPNLHIAPTPFSYQPSVTASPGWWPPAGVGGASPFTFPLMPIGMTYVITTVAGLTALTLDGQALFGGAFSIGQSIYVPKGHTLIATYAVTAPTFKVIPD